MALAQAGDREAMGRLMGEFWGWLRHLAAKHSKVHRQPFDDILQEAAILFVDAVRGFDQGRGVEFRGYVARRVPLRMLDIPRESVVALNRGKIRYARETGDKKLAHAAWCNPIGIDSYGKTPAPGMVGDVVAPGPEPDHPHAWAVADSLERMPGDLRTVVLSYYGFDEGGPRNMKQIGREIGVSESRVSQLHDQALDLLRERIARRLARHA